MNESLKEALEIPCGRTADRISAGFSREFLKEILEKKSPSKKFWRNPFIELPRENFGNSEEVPVNIYEGVAIGISDEFSSRIPVEVSGTTIAWIYREMSKKNSEKFLKQSQKKVLKNFLMKYLKTFLEKPRETFMVDFYNFF